MSRYGRIGIVALAVVASAAVAGSLVYSLGQEKQALGDKGEVKADSRELAAVKRTAEAFTKAFNAGDAKAVAAFWTRDGEFTGADGETLRGRDEIEKSYVEFFKAHPKATIEVQVTSLRLLGPATSLEEGSLKLKLNGGKEVGQSRYSVLHVREADGWKMASVREWVPDPAHEVTVKDVEWLVGKWVAKTKDAELNITYAWDHNQAFIRARYTLVRGKVTSSGTQIIGTNPGGGLRSWVFDSSGTFGESIWTREGDRWVIHADGVLPDGSEETATNLLIPIGKDAFTWQSVERSTAGTALPATAPLKVTRVPADK
jgi:uncharacterized protein (TIGR02246 family)